MIAYQDMRLTKAIRLSQADKLILTLGATCALPLAVHALAASTAVNVGTRWLPIFYAPLIAALCFRPHVALMAALFGPTINRLLLGAPAPLMAQQLTFELFFFNGAIVLLRRYGRFSTWQVVPLYLATRLLAFFVFQFSGLREIGDHLLSSVSVCWPGMLMLVALARTVNAFDRQSSV